jgi:prevent-host-death family protein
MEERMRIVNIHAAKTHLSQLVEQAAAGEEIIIAKSGKPVARLCPLDEQKKPRVLGRLRGQIVVPDDFDTLCEDQIRELFEKGC